MSRFSVQVIEDVSRNLQNIDIASFNKHDIEFPQHLLENIQEYIPIYQRFIDANACVSTHICLNHRYHVVDGGKIYDMENKQTYHQDFFVKYSPLLDPLRYMIGKYEQNREHIQKLPFTNNNHAITKLDDVNNCAYTDGFFYYLSSRLQET